MLFSPEEGDRKTFNAIPVPEYPNYRIAINAEGNPVLLLSIANTVKNISIRNFRLKYVQLEQNVECKITENGKSRFQTFTVITFTSLDRNLQEYFLRISETLIKTLNNKPTQQQVIDALNKFIEIFRSLTDMPTNTVQGLWAELFVIDNSAGPKILLNYWHNLPEEKFDFNSGIEKIEVKSSSILERIHTFSAEQLNPPTGTQVLIASVFVRQSSTGQNIQQLMDSIITKIQNDIELIDKLNNIICKTLGSSLEDSIIRKFDYQIAKDSLQFYRHQEVSKIDKGHISTKISEVKYKSDLTSIPPAQMDQIQPKGRLFNSIR